MRRHGQSKRIIGRSLLCQCPRRAFRLALCINAVLLLGGCGVNYRFCPSGTEKDPSRPFTTYKTTTPAKNRSCCFAIDRSDADAPSGITRRGVTMPVREMTKIVEHEIHAIVLCTTSRRKFDDDAIWRVIEPVFRAGETYPLPRDISRTDAFAYWRASAARCSSRKMEDGSSAPITCAPTVALPPPRLTSHRKSTPIAPGETPSRLSHSSHCVRTQHFAISERITVVGAARRNRDHRGGGAEKIAARTRGLIERGRPFFGASRTLDPGLT